MSGAFGERLCARVGKRVALDELRSLYFEAHPHLHNHPERQALLLQALRELEQQGAIALPARASWQKVGAPALPLWVTLRREPRQREEVSAGQIAWVPELGFWPELRQSQLAALVPLNEFLLRRRGTLTMVPIKERSLQIYGDEKRLDELAEGDTLFQGRLHLETLGCFRVPQPLPYRLADAAGKPVLVVENHNTYWSLGQWNVRARRFAAVVYGQGKNFHLTGRALDQVIVEASAAGACYFGDIDPQGIDIPMRFNARLQASQTGVQPALQLYRWLMAHGVRRDNAACQTFDASTLGGWLPTALAEEVAALWSKGRWLPQEALGIEALEAGALDGEAA